MLTRARIKSISAKIAKGVPQGAAAGSLGIPRRTFQNWLAAGRAEGARGIYLELAEEVDLALDRYHASRVVRLHKVGNDDPKVIQWELERRFRGDWGEEHAPATTINNNVVLVQERDEAAAVLLGIARRVLADLPVKLREFELELVGGEVVEGEAVEVAALTA